MVGLRYGAPDAVEATRAWMKRIARAAYLTSADLACEKGAFPLFDAEAYLSSGFMLKMDEDVRAAIRTHGIRNALLTSGREIAATELPSSARVSGTVVLFNADGTPYQSGGAPSEGLAWVDPEHSVGDSSRTKGEFGSSVSR